MSDQGCDEMKPYRRRRIPPPSSPLEDDNLLGEILLRLLLQPSCLPRASAVSKPWRRLATDAAFLRSAHHRKPPILGVFQKQGGELVFTSILDPPDRIPRERFSLRVCDDDAVWNILGCRHGRVLIYHWKQRQILVFDPVSGDRRTMAVPPELLGEMTFDVAVNGAVLCAAGDDYHKHVHGSCHQSPFKVVLVSTRSQQPASARVYSSETGIWGDLVSTTEPCTGYVITGLPCTLVGNALYWWLTKSGDGMLEFDLDSKSLAVINKPPSENIHSGSSRIIRGDDGGVRLAVLLYPSFELWDRKVDSHGCATWVRHKPVNMHEILKQPPENLRLPAFIAGYSEDDDAIFVSVGIHGRHRCFFIIRLELMQPTKLGGNFVVETYQPSNKKTYHPFTKFYTAGQPLLQLPATENYVWAAAGGDDRA